jgi:hypothetical protein
VGCGCSTTGAETLPDGATGAEIPGGAATVFTLFDILGKPLDLNASSANHSI